MPQAGRASAAGAAPGIEAWRDLVTSTRGRSPSDLRSRTRDGIVVEPLYDRSRDARLLPGRGARAWTIVQPVDDPDPDRANAQALEDIAGGATGLSIRFADSRAAGGSGLPVSRSSLAAALDGVDLARLHLRIEPHADILHSIEWLKALVLQGGIAPERVDVAFGLDPVAMLAAGHTPPPDPHALAACFVELRAARFRGPLAILDGRPYHEAGASEAQELGGILASASWWIHRLGEAGLAPADALPLIGATLATDRDLLLSIAKLRALRLLWMRLQELCAAPPTPLALHVETSRRMLTRADVATNLLRNTVAALAAAVGGADALTVVPHTAALGLADGSARALARNLQHLLIEESHLARTPDPAAGSGAIEALTDALAERAWKEFQAIEREGGIVESLRAGAFQARIATARLALASEVSRGAPLVGVTVHPSGEPVPPESHNGPAQADGLTPISLETLARAAA